MGADLVVLLNGKRALADFSVEDGELVRQVDKRLSELLSLPKTHRLLLRGKELSDPSAPFRADPGSTLYVISTSEETVANVKSAKPDPLLRGFSTPRSKYAARPASSSSGLHVPRATGFKSILPLPGKPNEAQAREILETLASDPGFTRVMEARKWSVGCLAEMEADGKVGVDPVCVLGYNTNKGQSIHLRLRTDNGNGFRPIWKLKEVLAHELAHNVHSEHDKDFYGLMSQVSKEARRNDWTQSSGRSAGPRGGTLVEGRDPLDVDGAAGPSLNIVRRLGSGPARLQPGYATHRLLSVPKPGEPVEIHQVLEPTEESEGVVEVEAGSDCGSGIEVDKPTPDAPLSPSGSDLSAADDIERTSVRAAPAVRTYSKPAISAEVQMLVAMGFSNALATVALRECSGAPDRAADWLANLSLERETETTESADGDASGAGAYVCRVRAAINDLAHETLACDQETAADALLALHLYVFNLLTWPSDARFRQINSTNAAYQRRVGRHAAGPSVLSAIGFTMQDSGSWLLDGSVDIARVWLSKSMLVQELRRQAG